MIHVKTQPTYREPLANLRWILALPLTLMFSSFCWAANFGTVVPVHGAVADIALDERHGKLYAANLTAYRVEVVNTATNKLLAPIAVSQPPSAVAVSLDNHFLVIGEYQKADRTGSNTPFLPDGGGLTVWDLDANSSYHLDFANPVLSIAFGVDGKALIVGRAKSDASDQVTLVPEVYLLDPSARTLRAIPTTAVTFGHSLSVPLETFPAQIIQAASGVSGDGKTIYVMAGAEADKSATSDKTLLLAYDVPSQTLFSGGFISSPPEGPRSIAVNQDASFFVFGWSLTSNRLDLWAQFPQADGTFQLGSHVWDRPRNLIYSNMPADKDGPVLSVADTDNLTIRERIRIAELLSGKSLLNGDSSVMYSASQGGVMILPVGQLPGTPRIGALQEDLLFLADSCNRLVLTRNLDIVSLGTAPADFTLTLPKGIKGVTLSRTSGTTPARIRVTIDPAAFQGAAGTTTIPLTITSSAAVNLPPDVRLLVNTRDFNQRGTILNVPGKLVDLLADAARSRLYILRQDKNLVLVYDMTTSSQIATLRTGNTPVHMALTVDNKYLLVGNDNSQIANVFDLDTLKATNPIIFPGGHYPRAFGVSTAGIFTLIRNAGTENCAKEKPTAMLDTVDFEHRTASLPCTLNAGNNPSIFENNLPTADGVIATTPAHDYLLMALSDGNVLQYDASAQSWVISRQDLKTAGGAYGALSGNSFLIGANLLGGGLVPADSFTDAEGTSSSGIALLGGTGLRTTTTGANAPGSLQRIDLSSLKAFNATPLAEAPLTNTILKTPTVGQIGQTILPFTRTLAVSGDQRTVFALTTSGLTIVPSTFDLPVGKPFIQSVVSLADLGPGVAPGGDININGFGFTPQSVWSSGTPLPETLGDVCVTVNDTAIPLFFVSPTKVIAQLPFFLGANATMIAKGPGGISDPFQFKVQGAAPALFSDGAGNPLVYRTDNWELVTFTNPIHPNQNIAIYLTGLGAVSPAVQAGQAAPLDPLSSANAPPVVTLGSTNTFVTFAGLVPGLVGVYQVNVTIPGVVQPGRSVPLTIRQGTNSTVMQVRVVTP